MNDRIKALYRSHILVNSKDESHYGKFDGATHVLEAYNPMCGDKYTLYIKLNNNRVERASFEGFGCAISRASTSVLCGLMVGKTLEEMEPTTQMFFELVNQDSDHSPESLTENENLLAFAAARDFPERKTCATLSWEELRKEI